MTNVAIVYYSATGNIHKLAVAAAEAAEKAGAEVRLRRVAEITGEPLAPNYKEWSQANTEHVAASRDVAVAEIDDLDWADAVVWGTPGRYGLLMRPAQALHRPDLRTACPARADEQGDVRVHLHGHPARRPGVHPAVAEQRLLPLGAVIVPPGVTDDILLAPSNGNPYGVSATSGLQAIPGHLAQNVTDDNLAAVGYQTVRTMKVAEALRQSL